MTNVVVEGLVLLVLTGPGTVLLGLILWRFYMSLKHERRSGLRIRARRAGPLGKISLDSGRKSK